MKLIINQDYEQMSLWAANHIANAINNHKEDRPFVLGLPTGSSPLGVYNNLIKMNKEGKVIQFGTCGIKFVVLMDDNTLYEIK